MRLHFKFTIIIEIIIKRIFNSTTNEFFLNTSITAEVYYTKRYITTHCFNVLTNTGQFLAK